MTNRRAIHSAATSDAKTLTHQASTNSNLAMDTPSTTQPSKNQMMGVAMRRSMVNGCSIFWNLKRDFSAAGAAAASVSGVGGDCIQGLRPSRALGGGINKLTAYYTRVQAIDTE